MTTPRTIPASRLREVGCTLGEGPLQHSSGDLCWVDINEHRLYRWDRVGDPSVSVFDEPVSALAETTDGGVLAATTAGLIHVTPRGDRVLVAPLPRASSDVRMNDGKADPFNRFVGGTMGHPGPRPGAGSLWSFGDGPPQELVAGVTISNGLAWSSGGETMFYIDSPTHRIDAFDYDGSTGRVSNRRAVVEIPAGAGGPDGMCIDAESGLWVALWGGSAVHRYVDGELDTIVEVPTPFVTCPAFAGPGLDELVITTASEPFASDAPAGAGDLYVVVPGPRGNASAVIDVAAWTADRNDHDRSS